eukprot:TRINITY_DN9278_c0_g1_i2.p1 TRINITY_DN9278_c0_g1~~TRINITY_DN9278_c0_g1_i2.p1  ORF type:complete len:138 (+),score=8.13 TRINITY_DN9278_c0_g1_i2:132-545(+)
MIYATRPLSRDSSREREGASVSFTQANNDGRMMQQPKTLVRIGSAKKVNTEKRGVPPLDENAINKIRSIIGLHSGPPPLAFCRGHTMNLPPPRPDALKNKPRTFQELVNCSHLFPNCLLYTSPSPRDRQKSRMPSSA